MKIDTSIHRIKPDSKVDLNKIDTHVDGGLDKDKAKDEFRSLRKKLSDLQELLCAESKHAVLVVFQAMDAGGKDSTIRSVVGPINPQGCRVASFKAPSSNELKHDYLWRIHQHAPARGMIGVFNRSHYEEVGIVRVHNIVPEQRWKKRYDHINAFEKLLSDEGTHIVKFFLHISKDYQRERFQRRLDRPDKHWKFNPDDLSERRRWGDYMQAYSQMIERCSTKQAPWYVIPAERRWYRNLIVTKVLVDLLEGLDMKYPAPSFDASQITIDD
ncbi:polyphosphate kinase 2 family protein [Planctomycetales bacterium ZRK34]|nr:polyphosphate kinase 2 family protein [Planctomycetales bacterium ZRK34]